MIPLYSGRDTSKRGRWQRLKTVRTLPLPSPRKSVAERDLDNRFSHDWSELAGRISNRYEPEGHNISRESERLLHLILQQHVISSQHSTQSQSAARKQNILHRRVDTGAYAATV
jgi:hypothetical protein